MSGYDAADNLQTYFRPDSTRIECFTIVNTKMVNMDEASGVPTAKCLNKRYGSDFTYIEYYNWMKNEVYGRESGWTSFQNTFENTCWDEWSEKRYCKDQVLAVYQTRECVKQMWRCFIKMSKQGSFPPVVEKQDAEIIYKWICMESKYKVRFFSECEEFSFPQMFITVLPPCFNNLSGTEIIKIIKRFYELIVLDTFYNGWIRKRSKRQNKIFWKKLNRRWCELEGTFLKYYKDPLRTEPCKELDIREMTWTYNEEKGRLIFTNIKDDKKLELRCDSRDDLYKWYTQFNEAKTGENALTLLRHNSDTSKEKVALRYANAVENISRKSRESKKYLREKKESTPSTSAGDGS